MTHKLSLTTETLRALSAKEAKEIGGGIPGTVNTCYSAWHSPCHFPTQTFCQR